MHLPSVEDVNATRLARFDDSISQALGRTEEIDQFRDIVEHYVEHHDVPEVDVAAALAVVAHGGAPLLLDADAEREREQFEAEKRAATAGRQRGGAAATGRSGPARERRPGAEMTTYRIAVGKRHKVEPRQIVGAIANEGGLQRGDFGAIRIHPGFSLVDLPADLSPEVLRRLDQTRISGVRIELRPDQRGARAARGRARGWQGAQAGGGGRKGAKAEGKERKPRHRSADR